MNFSRYLTIRLSLRATLSGPAIEATDDGKEMSRGFGGFFLAATGFSRQMAHRDIAMRM